LHNQWNPQNFQATKDFDDVDAMHEGFPPWFPHRGLLQEFPLGSRLQRHSDAEAVRALSADGQQGVQMGGSAPKATPKMGISLI
jgi:hypothetical protein